MHCYEDNKQHLNEIGQRYDLILLIGTCSSHHHVALHWHRLLTCVVVYVSVH
jgi:hypothetical protein